MKIKNLIALLPIISLAACATVTRGPNVDFVVITDPEGARVSTDLETAKSARKQRLYAKVNSVKEDKSDIPPRPERIYYGCAETPCKFEVSRRSEFEVSVAKEGFHTAKVNITSGYGGKGSSSAVTGATVTAVGGYVVSYQLFSGLGTALTFGLGSSSVISSAAASGASTAAAGIGVIFLGTDLLTGAMKDVRPNPLALVLIPEDQPLPEGEIEIIETEEELKDILNTRDGNLEKDAGTDQ